MDLMIMYNPKTKEVKIPEGAEWINLRAQGYIRVGGIDENYTELVKVSIGEKSNLPNEETIST